MKKLSRPPVLAHIHVPKCAGTSFRLLLDEVFPGGHLQLYFEPGSTERTLGTEFVFEDDQIAKFLEADSVRAFSSHYVRRFPAEVSGRLVYYITFLRNPVQQFISYIRFTRQVFAQIKDPALLSHLPPNMPSLELRDCARWLMNQGDGKFRNFQENYVTNFFARFEAKARYGYNYNDARYRRTRLTVAKRVLSKFFFVGLSEQMDESWRLLLPKLKKFGVEQCALPMRKDNVTENRNEDLSWLNSDDEVGKRVLESMREDLNLYAWGKRRFQWQVKEALQGSPLRWWQRTCWSELRG